MSTDTYHVAQREVHTGVLVCLTMLPTSLWLPALLGALHEGYALDTGALSRLAFSSVVGFLSGCWFTSAKTIPQVRRWVLGACALLVAANCALMLLAPAVPFIALQPLAGLGAGIGFGYVLKLCGASAHPTRNFGILTASMSVMMMIGFQVVAYLLGAYGMRHGVLDAAATRQVAKMIFAIYAACAVCAVLLVLANRRPEPGNRVLAPGSAPAALGPLVWLGLLAVVLSFMGQGGIWAFLQVLGTAHGFTVSAVANAMSAFAIMGVAGSLMAAAVPHRIGRSLLMSVAIVVLWGGLYALYAPVSLAWYMVGCAIGGFYWNFALPLMLGILARIDQSGRGPVLGGTMASAGSACGPLLASLVIHDGNFEPVGWMVGALCAAGLACMMQVERRAIAAAPLALQGNP